MIAGDAGGDDGGVAGDAGGDAGGVAGDAGGDAGGGAAEDEEPWKTSSSSASGSWPRSSPLPPPWPLSSTPFSSSARGIGIFNK